jgi:hypothetical protein
MRNWGLILARVYGGVSLVKSMTPEPLMIIQCRSVTSSINFCGGLTCLLAGADSDNARERIEHLCTAAR